MLLIETVHAMSDEQTTQRAKHGGGRAYHSRLEPFVDFVREQRRRRRTWKEIADLLRIEKGCSVTFQGVHQYYRRYVLRSRKPHWESPTLLPPEATTPETRPVLAETPPTRPFRRPPADDLTLNNPLNV